MKCISILSWIASLLVVRIELAEATAPVEVQAKEVRQIGFLLVGMCVCAPFS